MTEDPGSHQAALEAESRARLQALRLHEIATEAGERACEESRADADGHLADAHAMSEWAREQDAENETGTHRCPKCTYRFTPDLMDFYEVGPLSRRSQGDGPRDREIECPGCGKPIGEFDLIEL